MCANYCQLTLFLFRVFVHMGLCQATPTHTIPERYDIYVA